MTMKLISGFYKEPFGFNHYSVTVRCQYGTRLILHYQNKHTLASLGCSSPAGGLAGAGAGAGEAEGAGAAGAAGAISSCM